MPGRQVLLEASGQKCAGWRGVVKPLALEPYMALPASELTAERGALPQQRQRASISRGPAEGCSDGGLHSLSLLNLNSCLFSAVTQQ
ncbi:hypothetical protein EYF80_034213 [Liparis tanakae]|uniref:Uncharacterized protein n=1 Tax=Liparis tanakae TaxID=230148 RepID=A0A4Z2GR29_9TELE|nr:hypothetical protein EYF80_034213 [Liparis tanakae]